MEYGRAIVVDGLRSIELEPSQPVIYDREIGFRLLYQDPDSGAEHYLIRYPAGLKTRSHRHTAASRDAGSLQMDMGRCLRAEAGGDGGLIRRCTDQHRGPETWPCGSRSYILARPTKGGYFSVHSFEGVHSFLPRHRDGLCRCADRSAASGLARCGGWLHPAQVRVQEQGRAERRDG